MARNLKFRFATFLCLFIITAGCSDLDDNLHLEADTANAISKDDVLYNLIERTITTNETNPEEDIICVDFVYPFAVLVYNSNLEVVATQTITGDDFFKSFLNDLNNSYSVSISYLITSAHNHINIIPNKHEH